MDVDSYVGEVAAPFQRVRAFYTQCLGSEAQVEGAIARLHRPVTGTQWEPGGGPLFAERPSDMVDELTLWDRRDGTTEIAISIAMPDGR